LDDNNIGADVRTMQIIHSTRISHFFRQCTVHFPDGTNKLSTLQKNSRRWISLQKLFY